MRNKTFSLQQFSSITPGFSGIIEKNGKIIFEEYKGLANIEKKKKIDKNTQFRLASISKPFTAMAILILQRKGKLQLEDTINNYLPELPSYSKQVTILNLLNHTSGVPDHEKDLYKSIDTYNQPNIYEALSALVNIKKPLAKAGEKYLYSNSAYVLLAVIVERVSGITYRQFLNKEIFNKLELKNTTVMDNKSVIIKNRAYGYKQKNNAYALFDYDPLNFIIGDEGVYSNPLDLLTWWKAWKSEFILSDMILNNVFTVDILKNGRKNVCGISWFIKNTRNFKVTFHTGSWVGFTNIFVAITDKKMKDEIVIVFLSNTKNFSTQKSKFDAIKQVLQKANLEKYAMINL